MDQVFVVYGDVTPFPGMSGSADDRKILAVTDSSRKARELVLHFQKMKMYEYVDFEVLEME